MVDMIKSEVKQIEDQGSNQRPLPNHAVTGGMTPREGRASVLASPDLPDSARDLGSRGGSPSRNPSACLAEEFLRQYQKVRPDLDPEAMKKPGAGRKREHDPRKLLAAIMDRTADNPISISAWAAAAGMVRQSLQRYLPELRTRGLIATTGEDNCARQYLTPEGRQAAQEFLQETR
jgi:hypothetical protein